jgi:hypothetical protein
MDTRLARLGVTKAWSYYIKTTFLNAMLKGLGIECGLYRYYRNISKLDYIRRIKELDNRTLLT